MLHNKILHKHNFIHTVLKIYSEPNIFFYWSRGALHMVLWTEKCHISKFLIKIFHYFVSLTISGT